MKPDFSTIQMAVSQTGGYRPAARLLREQGFSTSEAAIRRAVAKGADSRPDFEVVSETFAEIDVEELIERRIKQFDRKLAKYNAERVVRVRVNVEGPIGLAFMGDWHADDDGTDMRQLLDHIKLLDGSVEGLFAGNLGDAWNNWAGRLERLYAEQSTSSKEALALIDDLLKRVNWMFYILGNHDLWGQGGDILTQILQTGSAATQAHRLRLHLELPNGRRVRNYLVHGFQGRSMWSDVFGAGKKAQLDGAHDIYAGAHTHVSGYTHGFHDGGQHMWHAVQVASYKALDRYADQLLLDRRDLYNCPVALIDPDATSHTNFIRFEFDPNEAAERLTWMRSRWSQGKST